MAARDLLEIYTLSPWATLWCIEVPLPICSLSDSIVEGFSMSSPVSTNVRHMFIHTLNSLCYILIVRPCPHEPVILPVMLLARDGE